MKKIILAIITIFCVPALAFAVPLDLSSWSADTYDLSGGQSAGNWALSSGNTTVTQTVNADPSVYLNNLNQTSYEMDGQWRVKTGSDDDFMGFVFGYQNDHQFYVLDWKQNTQNAYGGYAYEGFRILKVDAASRSGLDLIDFWRSNTSDSAILASSYGGSKGWADNTSYKFHLDFEPGVFSVTVSDLVDNTLWDVTVNDSAYTSGQFGFYNFSQQAVEYSGFEQTGGHTVPEPGTMLLLGSGILGFIGFRKKFMT